MPKSKSTRKASRQRPQQQPPRSPQWIIDEAVATVGVVVAHHHADVVTEQSALMIARTAVSAAMNAIPRISARTSGTAELLGELSDPRLAGGEMISLDAGPSNALLDVSKAVLLSEMQACFAHAGSVDTINDPNREPVWALQLVGRINHTDEDVRILFLTMTDGAADIAAEIVNLAMRAGPVMNAALSTAINAKLTQPTTEGN